MRTQSTRNANVITNELRLRIQAAYHDSVSFRINVIAARTPAGRVVKSAPAGFPDLIAVIHGRFVAIEVKAGRDRLTAEQISLLAAIERCGGVVIVAREVEPAMAELGRKLEAGNGE